MNHFLKKLQKAIIFFVHSLLRLLQIALSPVFAFVYESKSQEKLPAITNEICRKPAVELASLIRERKLKSEEVVQAFIERIGQINVDLNVVIANRFEAALQEAIEIDKALDSGNVPDKWSPENAPLLGVPFTAKEAFGVVGLPNTAGLLSRSAITSKEDADAVKMMKSAGAIPIGLTNCSELCMWYESSNLNYGRANNAYHQGRIVGGSSGGEGCVLSAAGSVFGIGSDIGGSIRMPAFFNGVFGHKPSSGFVSNLGQFPIAKGEAMTFLSTGPMCRYAADLIPMFKALLGPEDCKKLQLDEEVIPKKLKVFYMLGDGSSFTSPVQDEIQASILKAVKHMADIGCEVQKVSLPDLRYSFDIWSSMMSSSGNDKFCVLMGGGKPVNPWVELLYWIVGRPRHTLPAIGLGIAEKAGYPEKMTAKLRERCTGLKLQFEEMLGDNGVFFYPTHPVPAPYHNQPLTLIPNFSYTGIVNVLGLPATNVPMGLAQKERVPIGFQVIGGHKRDRNCLAIAKELEKAFGGWALP